MPFFSKVFRGKDASKKSKHNAAQNQIPPKPTWQDAWTRKTIEPEEIQELLRGCTYELKSRGLDVPFLLLPFRPASDPSATRTFIRNFFGANSLTSNPPRGEMLMQELRLTEPLVICSVMKWCWSRLAGGVVTWEAYELFKIGEHDSSNAPDAFATFIPISVTSDARSKIIFDFFETLAAIAAHGKANGFPGRKLARYAGWWAFEFADSGNGFEGGYKTWAQAADATSHLFFAYLRSLSPESAQGKSSILNLPISLQQLLESTEYPLAPQEVVQRPTSKVVMIVETVSPTPFALLRRAKNFHYREEDYVLQEFSDYDDPVAALTDECKRVLKSIATANESTTSKTSTSLRDASWSRFEDIGFSGFSEDFDAADEPEQSVLGRKTPQVQGLRTTPANKTTDLGRPTTPSWADFLSSGFNKDAPGGGNPALLLPPDKQLPPINTRSQTSQSHRRGIDDESMLEPGELASIVAFSFDDTFWWVWMTSLAGEETPTRKSAFGRCALVETSFSRGWLIMEEIIKGAAPEPEAGAYIAEKKSRFGFSRRTKISRSKSSGKNNQSKADAVGRSNMVSPASKTSIAPDQQARVQAAAAALQQRNKAQQAEEPLSPRRARQTEEMSMKTNSVLTLQPMLMNEAAQAMKWANSYDKNAIRAKYLGDNFAGRGSNISLLNGGMSSANNASTTQIAGANGNPGQGAQQFANKENVPPVPPKKPGSPEPRDESRAYPGNNTALLEMLNKGPPGGPGGGRSRSVQEASQLQDKSTPGLPVAPAVPSKERSAQEEVVPAAIPLPGDTPAPSTPTAQKPPMPEEYPRRMERKPVQSTAGKENQPPQAANAQDSIEKSSANGKAAVAPPSPESPKHNKLKKKNPQGGFKGIFGRKKAEPPAKDPPPRSVSSSSAVAAARAALEAKATQNQKPPEPSSKSNAKRFSVGRKKEAESAPEPVRTAPTVPEEPEERQAPVPQHEAHDHAQRNQSTVDSEEQRAEREFSKFDQGPLEDVPAFVPEDNPHEQAEHFAPSEVDQEYDDEINTGDVSPARISEDDGAELTRTISPNDRWAQIRKNAADRAAMRQSEEQSRRTDRTDDDGDTSGEETIESRVARIKARVAELTGNMDLPANRR